VWAQRREKPVENGNGMMDGGMMTGVMGGVMLFWGLLGLALLVLAVVATIWLAKRISPSASRSTEGPEDVLRRRYAAGEIDRDEFLRVQSELTRR
jgi:putative membrane protein